MYTALLIPFVLTNVILILGTIVGKEYFFRVLSRVIISMEVVGLIAYGISYFLF